MARFVTNHDRKSHSARCGHVARCVNAGIPMPRKVLDFALMMIESSRVGFSDGNFLDEMARKLANQIPLSEEEEEEEEEEEHILVDVLLCHSRIRGTLERR